MDAYWTGDVNTRRAVSGCVVMVGGGAVSWSARQQEDVALSSTEAEYISICAGVIETVWIRRMVQGIGMIDGAKEATNVYVDNQGEIALTGSTPIKRRTKHMDVRYHYTRQAVVDGVVYMKYCGTEERLADMLTKALGRVKLQKFVKDCGMIESVFAQNQ